MRLNEIAKGLVIAAPMFVLAACGSTSTTEADTQQQVNQVVEEVVQTNSVEKVLSPAEKQRLELEALRQEHIIYFDFDTSTVSSEFATLLDAHATYLRAKP